MRFVFVGNYRDAISKARELRKDSPKLVSNFDHLVGFRGPLTVYLCNGWKHLPDRKMIMDYLKSLKNAGEEIKIIL